MQQFGVYGYECSRKMEFDSYTITPITTKHADAKRLAADQKRYFLTATLEFKEKQPPEVLRKLLFDLEAVLSFIDQMDVIILAHPARTVTQTDGDQKYIVAHPRNKGCGQVIISDCFETNSRKEFIVMALQKLEDDQHDRGKAFRTSFFREIEVFRGRTIIMDVTYYLLFSSLEALSRAFYEKYDGSAAEQIAKLLKNYNFDVKQDNYADLKKGISNYTELRNALFHNGKTEKTLERDNRTINLKLVDFHDELWRLLPFVLIKYIGFDDGHINWNGWLDRNYFK